jgi:putative peptide zinc metalloprotease protein
MWESETFSGYSRIAQSIFCVSFSGGNMQKAGKTFSESWYRVADLKVSLHPSVTVSKRRFRGEMWHMLCDPFNNQYFRLRPEAHDFVIRLRPDRTVAEVWEECLNRNPDGAPGQEDVIQLLTQLYFANLLHFEKPADSAKLFERYRKRQQRELQSKLLSILFMRLPLFDPDDLLKKVMPAFKYLISSFGAAIWLAVVGVALKLVIDRSDMVWDQAQGILAPGNLFLLYMALVAVKTIHEFGHALVCRRYGGEVHTMGVMLLVFTPLPYMDATSSWSFRSRWKRALVGAAGMISEIFVAALATFVWAYAGQGTLSSLAYNIMFIASVSTVLFNGNPLLRFDGYYILSDLLDIPNLSSQAMKHLRHLVERYAFGYKESYSPAQSPKEKVYLTIFGVVSGIYRVVVFTGIIFFVADKFLLAGLVMALIGVVSWGVVPLFKLVIYLASNPRLAKTRIRAVFVCMGFLTLIGAFLALFPVPDRFRAPGVMETMQYVQVVNDAPGYVKGVIVSSGMEVKSGTPLVELTDRELEFEIEAISAQRKETLAMQLRALRMETADLQPIRKRLETVDAKLKDLEAQRASLTVRAREAGIWVAPPMKDLIGAWLNRGSVVGQIVNEGAFRFSAIVSQDEATELFTGKINKAEVRLHGQGGENLAVSKFKMIPYKQQKLPSAALGWRGGGDVPISAKDEKGVQAAEPFFQIYADIVPSPEVLLLHGMSGKLRLTLNPKPLLFQWVHKFRQLLQKRYQI